MRTALKWLLFLPTLIFFVLIFKTPAVAASGNQTPTAQNQNLTPALNPDVPQNLHSYTQSVFLEFLSVGYCQLTGYDPLSQNHKCLGIDKTTHKIGFVENGSGLIGLTGNLIAMTYKMPTSTSDYINYLASNFGLTKKTYAADSNPCEAAGTGGIAKYGAGFCSVSPLTPIWAAMRNLVYLIFTIIFVLIGLGIMLRINIDPRTVMTLENQIPKIIIGILLVTFSLAIAGLLIDAMYVIIYLLGSVFNNVATSAGITFPNPPYPTGTTFAGTYGSITTSSSPIDATQYFHADFVGGIAEAMSSVIASNIHTGVVIFGTDILKAGAQLVLFLIFLLAFWIAILRVWISLIMAYIMVLLDVVFAPFWFLLGLLPGGSLGPGAWLRDIAANLAVFPVTIAMFALGIIFLNMPTHGAAGQLFNPPLVGGFKYGYASGNDFILGQLIAFGFLFMTPQALSMVKSAIKAPKLNVGPVFQPASSALSSERKMLSAGVNFNRSQTDKMGAKGLRSIFDKI